MKHQTSAPPTRPPADLSALSEFVVVARLAHMTRAAQALGLPQSTLSRRIARLEAAVGVPLLLRTGRRIEVTRDGALLAEAARRAVDEVERVLDDLAAAHDPERGVVTLAFLHTLGPAAVPAVIREFARLRPKVRFRLVQESHREVVRRLRTGEADVALTAPLPQGPDVASFPLLEQRLCVVAPREHPLSARARVELSSLADEAFVGFKPGYGLRTITDEWCRSAGFEPALSFEGEDVATVRGLVAAGLGIALLPETAAAGGEVTEVEVRRPRRTRTIGMAWMTDRSLPPPALAFRNFLLERGPALVADVDGGPRHT